MDVAARKALQVVKKTAIASFKRINPSNLTVLWLN